MDDKQKYILYCITVKIVYIPRLAKKMCILLNINHSLGDLNIIILIICNIIILLYLTIIYRCRGVYR